MKQWRVVALLLTEHLKVVLIWRCCEPPSGRGLTPCWPSPSCDNLLAVNSSRSPEHHSKSGFLKIAEMKQKPSGKRFTTENLKF